VIGSFVVAVILLGVLAVVLVTLLWLRPSVGTKGAAIERVDPTSVEREVYEKLYGTRSTTVSAPAPHEASPGAQANTPRRETPSSKRRPKTASRPREHAV
jgi:hypothetical protein